MDKNKNPNIIPFPNLVKWWDIAKGVGEVVFHSIFDQVRHDPVNEFDQSSWTPVQRDAAEWMDKLDTDYDHYTDLRKDLGL